MFAVLLFFFFNDTATTEIYTLSLHDALPISAVAQESDEPADRAPRQWRRAARRSLHVHEQPLLPREARLDRKSTRLNSSHLVISYAVFCLKKKKRPVDSFC